MIKDLPAADKPREKALEKGVSHLTNAELIAILLRTGTKNSSALDVAQRIINFIGDVNNYDVITLEKLSMIKGVGPTKAITILSAIELGKRSLMIDKKEFKISDSKSVYNYLKYYFYMKKQELFYVLFLDNSKKLIKIKKIYQGTNNTINITQNEIFKEAYIHSCSNIIIAHNHPSGFCYPSNRDYETTKKIIKSGEILNIHLLDHIIITDKGYYSFADNGDLK